MKHYLLLLFLLVITTLTFGQSSYAPLNEDYDYLIGRYEIAQGRQSEAFDTNIRPYRRRAIGEFLDSVTLSGPSSADQFNLNYLRQDNWEYTQPVDSLTRKPLLKYFYRRPSDFWYVQNSALTLHVNPVLHWELGQGDSGNGLAYTNTRGIQIHGNIDRKVAFYTYIGENQMIFPNYVDAYVRRTLTVPQEGFWKGFGERGVDFVTARGHIGLQATRHIQVQFGYGKHFIGPGYRSLVLSDFSNNYTFLRIDTEVWRLHYTNLFAQLTADIVGNRTGLFGTVRFPPKYMALHRLGVRLGKRVDVGLFESVIHGSATGQFEVSYLNPIIFYRAIEQQGGSVGNALLGLDFSWIIGRSLSLYGQGVLDEFVLSEVRSGEGWWGNKYAVQVGGEYINVLGLANLDLQIEYNRVRPYTYAHDDLYRSYTHYEQPLAHPLGANFSETLAILRYQPVPRLSLKIKLVSARSGSDQDSTNWGGNVLLDNRTREQDYGNALGQGVATQLLVADGIASYQAWHNVFVDARFLYRTREQGSLAEKTTFASLALRWNIRQRYYDF